MENDGKKIILYDYHPNQLLKTRLTTNPDGKILKREFFHYDESGALTHNIWDDGQTPLQDDLSYVTERHIKIITPRAEYPVGLPQIADEYYMDMASLQYIFLKRIIYHHSAQGKVLQEYHYGSDGNFAYQLSWDYHHLGNVSQKIDALGQVTTYHYDANGNKIREEGPLPGWYKEFSYDLTNCLTSEIEHWPNGNVLTTTHGYNKLNQRKFTRDTKDYV